MPPRHQREGRSKRGEERRGGGLRRLPETITRVLDPAARRRGLAGAALLTDWTAIVGPALAARCHPVKLGRDYDGQGGVLHLRVSGTAALELQHAGPQLLERINTHFGYPAVAGLRLIQAPLARSAKTPAPPPATLGPADAARIEATIEGVCDDALKAALGDLGRAIARRARSA